MSSRQKIKDKEYTALLKQGKFHHSVAEHRNTLFNGGRGSGKTTAGAIQAIMEAMEYQPGESGLIVAPTYDLIRKAVIPELLKWIPRQWIKRYVKSPSIVIELFNGSSFHFGSSENHDSLRGPNRAWLWMDEPRNMRTREPFDIASAQVRRGNEKIWLSSTPSGIFHWMYELFVANPIMSSNFVTSRTDDNPYTSQAYKDQLRSQYTGKFAAQELDAAFVSFEGLIYDNFSIPNNVTTDAEYNPDLDVYWGVDDGYAHGGGLGTAGFHPRAIVLCQVQPDGSIYVFDEYYRTLQLPEATIKELVERPYDLPQLAKVDSSAAELRRRFHEAGIMSGGATHRVVDGIKVVRRFICDGNGVRLLKIHPRCKNLIRELQTYRYDDKGNRVEAGEPKPLKMDDHLCDALRYIIWNFR